MYDFVIIGGGIIGLAIAANLSSRYPDSKIAVLEKENAYAAHQSGNNSGVIHSGVYYKPNSFKAEFCRKGNKQLVEFCQKYDIPHDICGKVIVATHSSELIRLDNLFQRGLANKIAVTKLTPEQVKEYEPHVECVAGFYVPTAGIVDYRAVCDRLVQIISAQGGEIFLGTKLLDWHSLEDRQVLVTNSQDFETSFAVNCAGLHSDRVAGLCGMKPSARIIPFRGEYYTLTKEKSYLVNSLIYPVPDPSFPFLGVHFTKCIDGSVHAGPNAVLSLKREGYRKTDVNLRDMLDTLSYEGFWRLAVRHWDAGIAEIWRSFSRRAFVRSLQSLIPSITIDDIEPSPAGVRAQALKPDGNLVEDFVLLPGPGYLHVCNAPSPAATSSLAIGEAVVNQIPAPNKILTRLSS